MPTEKMKKLFAAAVLTLTVSVFAGPRARAESVKSASGLRPDTTGSPTGNPEDKARIQALMRANFEALLDLQPYIASRERFGDPKNNDKIRGLIGSFSDIRHVFPEGKPGEKSTQEPGFAAIGSLFSDYLSDIKAGFESGSKEYARRRLQTMKGFCLSCHTRVGTEKNFADLQSKVEQSDLTAFQKAEFYAATRQFDKALTAYDLILTNTPPSEPGLIDFTHAVRQTLSITVRVKKDPKKTYYFLEKLSERKDLPEFFRHEVEKWKEDAAYWMKERKERGTSTEEQLIAHARKLVERAQKLQLFAADHSGDVSYLRATNYVHELLQRAPATRYRGEALYLLGVSYDALQDPLLWALDELYFESCVRENPHSEIARKCYRRYSAKIYFGYSGSGGTMVPEDEMKKLTELRKLSE